MTHLYWVALKSIWAKEINRFMRIWVQTLVPPVITMTLYFIIFGNLIGSRIGEMHGFTYMQFIVPGLIMMAVITNAYANVASSFFSAKFQRNIEELLVAPVPTHVIIAGYVGGGVARQQAWRQPRKPRCAQVSAHAPAPDAAALRQQRRVHAPGVHPVRQWRGQPGLRLRLAGARIGRLQARRCRQGFGDQRIELRIGKRLPPRD